MRERRQEGTNFKVLADMEQFVIERNEALLSLDMDKIIAYGKKWGVDFDKLPKTEEGFWGSVHKARTAIPALPMAERSLSKKWLLDRGMLSMDDGSVPFHALPAEKGETP